MKAASISDPLVLSGEFLLDVLTNAGRLALFLGQLARETLRGLRYGGLIVEQCMFVGVGSLPLITLTSLFIGAVASLQAALQFRGTVPELYIGTVLAKSVFIELGPVLTALVVGARTSASMAAQLGTMRVTEQIDALEVMAIRPVRYLVVPRVVATTLMLPVITVFAEVIALLGGMVVATTRIGMSQATFLRGMRLFFEPDDIYGGLLKSFAFGSTIAIAGCFYGFHADGGAEGVGHAATRAVVASCVLVLVLDYFLAEVIFRLIFPTP